MVYLEHYEVPGIRPCIDVGGHYVLKDEDEYVFVVKVTLIVDLPGSIVRVEPSVHFEYVLGLIGNGYFDENMGSGVMPACAFATKIVTVFGQEPI